MDKFRHKLPKDLLKRYAKDVNKSLVASDYKHNRVQDPTAISDKQVKKVKIYVRDFLDKAVAKHRVHEKQKAGREAKHGSDKTEGSSAGKAIDSVETPGPLDADDDAMMSDVEAARTSSPVKRKREDDEMSIQETSLTPDEMPLTKRLKEQSPEEPGPPPPPPPPPDAGMDDDMASSQIELLDDGLQVEFSLEQEAATRLASEAEKDRVRQEEALQRENEEAMREFELEQTNQHAVTSNGFLAATTPAFEGSAAADTQHVLDQRNKQAIPGQ